MPAHLRSGIHPLTVTQHAGRHAAQTAGAAAGSAICASGIECNARPNPASNPTLTRGRAERGGGGRRSGGSSKVKRSCACRKRASTSAPGG